MKRTTDLLTPCPRCKTPINITAQAQRATEQTGHSTLPNTLYASLYCATCNMFTVALFLQPEDEVDKRGLNTVVEQLIKDLKKPEQVD